MKSSGSSSNPDYSGEHMGFSTACYNSPHIEPIPWWGKKGSSLGTPNFHVDHCNIHNKADDKLVLPTLTVDCYSEVTKSIRSTEQRAWISHQSHGFLQLS